MLRKSLYILGSIGAFILLISFGVYRSIVSDLPPIESINDYKPLLVTQVYDRNNQKIGEFFKERRTLVEYEQIPKLVVQAFLAAEDDQFFQHKGVNWLAVLRAAIANIKAGQTVQGASTITQQLVKTMFLTPERTFERKFKEMLLSQKLESRLSKEEILYLYLNQIFFGQNSYGIGVAAETYFRKPVQDLTVAEAAILAGLPKAPSAYSPVRNPKRAKERQIYVLNRMADLGYIPRAMADEAIGLPIKVYLRESFVPQSHGFVETIRLLLSKEFPEDRLASEGFSIHTTIDLEQQIKAQASVEKHLRDLDKRQGFRGELERLEDKATWSEYLQTYREQLIQRHSPERVILPTGEFDHLPEFNQDYMAKSGLPSYMSLNQNYRALILEVNDTMGIAIAQIGELKGIIDLETTRWARPFNPETRPYHLNKLSAALQSGDVVWAKVTQPQYNLARLNNLKTRLTRITVPEAGRYAQFELEQEPLVEGALLSLDHIKQDVIALVGGYSFTRSQFNRVLQAQRQSGSAFKTFIYAAALDQGYHPSSLLLDAPIVYENQGKKYEDEWKPTNYSRAFNGEITFRNALIRSLNIPTVKVIEDIGVPMATDYARRLQIFSPLNPDFTLALGSSSVTLYEITKAFGIFARLGKNLVPRVVTEVKDRYNEVVLENVNLDLWFADQLKPIQEGFEERRQAYLASLTEQAQEEEPTSVEEAPIEPARSKKPPLEPSIFFNNPDQLISPQTAYLMTSILRGVIRDPNGTAGRVNAEIAYDVAGKTGSTNDYVDGWFVGYSPLYTTGVWVGFDQERTLGPAEVGGRTALPIWADMMQSLHERFKDQKEQPEFTIPSGIELVDVDYETGETAKPGSSRVITQAFRIPDLKKLEEAQVREHNVEATKEDLFE